MFSLRIVDHIEIDDQTKRVNQLLENMLRTHVYKKQTSWEHFLSLLKISYNNVMACFNDDLTLIDQTKIFQEPIHPIVLNFKPGAYVF